MTSLGRWIISRADGLILPLSVGTKFNSAMWMSMQWFEISEKVWLVGATPRLPHGKWASIDQSARVIGRIISLVTKSVKKRIIKLLLSMVRLRIYVNIDGMKTSKTKIIMTRERAFCLNTLATIITKAPIDWFEDLVYSGQIFENLGKFTRWMDSNSSKQALNVVSWCV